MHELNWIDDDDPLPPTRQALGPDSDAPGLLAAGGRLTPQRLDEAYRHGVFPWYSRGQPVLWWSPDPRMVLPVAEFKLSRSLAQDAAPLRRAPGLRGAHRQRLRARHRRLRAHAARRPGTAPGSCRQMVRAYSAWHRARPRAQRRDLGRRRTGRAACTAWPSAACSSASRCSPAHRRVEDRAGRAGVPSAARTASTLIDCQQNTGHLASLGAREMPRAAFERHLSRTLGEPDIADWTYDSRMWPQLDALRGTPDSKSRA